MNPEKIGKNIAKFLLMEEITETVALYPGAFKPPHKGHVDVVLQALNFALNNDRKVNGPTMPSSTQTPGKAIVFVSEKTRENVDYNESLAVWDLYKEAIPELSNVEFITTPTPVKAVYDYVKENPTHDIKAVFGKGEESRFKSLQNKEKYPNVEPFNAGTFQNLSATNLRQAIRNQDKETIKTFLPDGVDVNKFLSIFNINEVQTPAKEKSQSLKEGWEPQKAKVINKFLHFASDYLHIDRPKIKLLNGPEFTQTYHSFGGYHPGQENIQIVVYNRNMADILRTLAHEMVHRMQHLDDRLGPNSGEDGSPEENEANALAGVMLRQFGRENPGIYE